LLFAALQSSSPVRTVLQAPGFASNVLLIQINVVIPDSVQNITRYIITRGVNKAMSSLEKNNDSEAETFRNMSINIAVIFGVITGLIILSIYLAGA
jgi:hypothetical protein